VKRRHGVDYVKYDCAEEKDEFSKIHHSCTKVCSSGRVTTTKNDVSPRKDMYGCSGGPGRRSNTQYAAATANPANEWRKQSRERHREHCQE